ncbi:MAG: hypothetical protein R3E96_06200 [Planctomycetota bacterium]
MLVPTDLERQRLATVLACPMELAGFGPIAAAARTASLLAERCPPHVWLLGIAGTYDEEAFPIATARAFRRFGSWGVGAGEGPEFRTAGDLGWPHWPGPPAIGDRIDQTEHGPRLVTVCAASSGPDQPAAIRRAYPDALAEDMEAFAVAFACGGIPFTCIRGASNVAGDRNVRGWQIERALDAVAQLALDLIPSENR